MENTRTKIKVRKRNKVKVSRTITYMLFTTILFCIACLMNNIELDAGYLLLSVALTGFGSTLIQNVL